MNKPNIARLSQGYWRQDPIWRGLVGAWFMPEGGGLTAYDYSGYGNHGTLTGGPTWSTGKFGGAISFDGSDDHIITGKTFNNSQFSYAVWAYPTSTATNKYILFEGGASSRNIGVLSSSATWYVWPNDATLNAGSVSLNVWAFLALTYDGGTLRLYKDGVLKASLVATPGAGGNLFIGRYGPSTGFEWAGKIDSLCLFNRNLIASEVRQLYINPFPDVRRRTWFVPAVAVAVSQVPQRSDQRLWGVYRL